MPNVVKYCKFCNDPVVWREEYIPKPERTGSQQYRWIPMEASTSDPSQPERFDDGVAEYEERGRLKVSKTGKKPKTLMKHICNGMWSFSNRERGRKPSWQDWG